MFIFNPLSRSAYVCEAQRDDFVDQGGKPH